jgi:hypothetical protein
MQGDQAGAPPSEWLSGELAQYPDWVTAEDVCFAYGRLARIFHVQPVELTASQRFGSDLTSSFESLFRPNEMRRLYFDVEDLTQEFGSDIAIPDQQAGTVRGYCLLMSMARRLCIQYGYDLQRILQPV